MILVCGATGVLGGLITRNLMTEGRDVRILVRHSSPAEEMALQGMATSPRMLIASGARPVYGDLKEKETLVEALKGIETVITTANSAMRGSPDNVDTVDRQGNRNLIEAANAAGVSQFIFISFLGADLHHPVPLFQAKAETEVLLSQNGMTYTILAPNFFIESWAGMVIGLPLRAHVPVTLVGEGKRQHSFISIADVAAFATSAIGLPDVYNKRIPLGGPEAVSWQGIVNAFGNELGTQLPAKNVLPGEPIPGLPEIVAPTLAAMETYDSIIPMEETARIFGVKQTPLPSVVHQMLAA